LIVMYAVMIMAWAMGIPMNIRTKNRTSRMVPVSMDASSGDHAKGLSGRSRRTATMLRDRFNRLNITATGNPQ